MNGQANPGVKTTNYESSKMSNISRDRIKQTVTINVHLGHGEVHHVCVEVVQFKR